MGKNILNMLNHSHCEGIFCVISSEFVLMLMPLVVVVVTDWRLPPAGGRSCSRQPLLLPSIGLKQILVK